MASRQETVDSIVFFAAGAGAVSVRKMFGEHALYCDGTLVALVCDDQLFVKPTDPGRALAGAVTEAAPYHGAKPSLLIPRSIWEDGARLSALVRATADALARPGTKTRKKPAA